MIKLNPETRKALIKLAEETQVFPEGNILKLLDTEDDEAFKEYIAKALARDRSMRQRRLEITKQIQIQNRDLSTSNEKVTRLNDELLIALDEQKKAKDQVSSANLILEKKNKDLEQFSWMTSHNLRGPLASTMGIINLLESFLKADPNLKTLHEHLKSSAEKMNDILADISMLLETRNSQVIFNEELYLEEFVSGIIVRLEKDASVPSGVFQTDFTRCPVVISTKTVLYDVLCHLLLNGYQYRHKDREPVVRISSEVLEGDVVIKVSDNGCGIRKEDFEAIFEPFKKLSYASAGKGLGLYLARTHADALGGALRVSSEVEVGSEFLVYLPIPQT